MDIFKVLQALKINVVASFKRNKNNFILSEVFA